MLAGTDALTVTIPPGPYEVARGNNITVPCSFQGLTDPSKLVMMQWSSVADQVGADDVRQWLCFRLFYVQHDPLFCRQFNIIGINVINLYWNVNKTNNICSLMFTGHSHSLLRC